METNKKRARSEEVPVSKGGTAGRAGTWVRNKECGRAGRRDRGSPTAGSGTAVCRSLASSPKY